MVKNSIVLGEFFAEAFRYIAHSYVEQYYEAYRNPILENKEDEKALAMHEDLRLFLREKVKEKYIALINHFIESVAFFSLRPETHLSFHLPKLKLYST